MFRNLKERHAELVEASLPRRLGTSTGVVEMLRQAQHDVLEGFLAKFKHALSLDYTKPLAWHFAFARQLRFLRKRGVLLIGSGNIVHNTRLSVPKLRAGDTSPFAWATDFDEWVKQQLDQRDFQRLVAYEQAGTSGLLAVPTPDHYLPLLYSAGLAQPDEPVSYAHEEVSFGGLSMRTFQIG